MMVSYAQVSVNIDGADPDPSAMLDIQSTDRGFLMPRMTENDRMAINAPASGLLLFQTDAEAGFYYNHGTPSLPEWARLAIQQSDLVCDKRIPIDSVFNGSNYEITESGSYYFTEDISLTFVGSTSGITIDADNVTLDLNGYSLNGNGTGGDGISVFGTHNNITIKNGVVANWGENGIFGFRASQSFYLDLVVRGNALEGMFADFNSLIHQCVVEDNGFSGIRAEDGSIISNSTASNNGRSGIFSRDRMLIVNCTTTNNERDGIDARWGSRVENCNSFRNGIYGIDLGEGSQVVNCVVNENRSNGINLSGACLAMYNVVNGNGQCWLDGGGCAGIADDGAGINASFGTQLLNNTCSGNIMGIRISGVDNYVSDNQVQNNRHVGLVTISEGSLIIRNRGANNGFNPVPELQATGNDPDGNIIIDPNCTFGPIIDVSASGDIVNTLGADHPYANYVH
ncbi:MAG: right-handed parallel beta-helix repeat-containing protein [Bacteroidota bacterium]